MSHTSTSTSLQLQLKSLIVYFHLTKECSYFLNLNPDLEKLEP